MAHLAQLAEEAGRDGIFLEDYIVYQGEAGGPGNWQARQSPWITFRVADSSWAGRR